MEEKCCLIIPENNKIEIKEAAFYPVIQWLKGLSIFCILLWTFWRDTFVHGFLGVDV